MANNYLVHRISGLEDDEQKYGIPELKKYPMPDAAHVRSAIRFFNYVEPAHEKELAVAILKRMKEYGLTFEDFTVGEENRFSKYVPESALKHYGIKGMKWGVRRFQNADGSLTEAGRARYSTGKVGFRRAPKPEMKIYSHEGKRAARKIKKDQGNTPLQEIIKSEKQRIGLAFLSAFLNTFVGNEVVSSSREERKQQKEEVKKQAIVKERIEMAKYDQLFWEHQRDSAEKYLKALESGEYSDAFDDHFTLNDAISEAKHSVKKYSMYAQDWLDTQKELMDLDYSSMSVKELKKKTSRSAVINRQIERYDNKRMEDDYDD